MLRAHTESERERESEVGGGGRGECVRESESFQRSTLSVYKSPRSISTWLTIIECTYVEIRLIWTQWLALSTQIKKTNDKYVQMFLFGWHKHQHLFERICTCLNTENVISLILPTAQTNHSYGWLITFGSNGLTIRPLNRLRSPKQIKSFVNMKRTYCFVCLWPYAWYSV